MDVSKQIEKPVKAMCLYGTDGEEKLEMIITHVFSYNDSYDGIDFKGRLNIKTGCYEVSCNRCFFSTGALERFYEDLKTCYNTLKGEAGYAEMFSHDGELLFSVVMTKHGHAEVNGYFEETTSNSNKLIFNIKTDQTHIEKSLEDIKMVLLKWKKQMKGR